MKTKYFLLAILTVLLLLPMKVKAAVQVENKTIDGIVYDLCWERVEDLTAHAHYAVVKGMSQNTAKLQIPEKVTFTYNGSINDYYVTQIAEGAFAGNTILKRVGIGTALETIGIRAFADCSNLADVLVPATNSLKRIRNSAFEGCTSLANITVPKSVTSLGSSAFKNCTSLTTFPLQDGSDNALTTISANAFEGCTGLTDITIPCTITSIGSSAFSGCSNLNDVRMYAITGTIATDAFANCDPDKLKIHISDTGDYTTVADGLFEGCSRVGQIVLNDGITAVGANAFKDCTTLFRLEISTSVRSFGADALYNISPFNLIINPSTISNGHTDIAANLFQNNTLLSSLTINSGVTEVGESAFQGCTNLKNLMSDLPPVVGKYAFSGCTLLPNVDFTGVQTIGRDAFASCTTMTTVLIPESVTTIGEYAFQLCSNLTNVELPLSTSVSINSFSADASDTDLPTLTVVPTAAVTTVADSQYDNQFSFSKVVIGEGITAIGEKSFHGIPTLKAVELPTSLTTIGDYAFQACTNLVDLTMYATTTNIGTGAFNDCGNINLKIDAFSSNATVADNLFKNCQQLVSLTTNRIKTIGASAFEGCIRLAKVDRTDTNGIRFNNTVTTIGDKAFYGCTDLEGGFELVSVITIGQLAFYGTKPSLVIFHTTLDDISSDAFDSDNNARFTIVPATWDNSTTIRPYLFKDCAFLKNTSFTEGLTEIGAYAFQNCTNLSTLSIPNGTTTIGLSCFDGCSSLTKVVIPESVQSLGASAFNISTLTDVTVKWDTPIEVNPQNDPFPTTKSDITLHVPFGLKPDYQNHSYWGLFGNIVMPETAEIADNQTIRYRLHAGDTEAENWAEVIGIYDHENISTIEIPSTKGYMSMSFPVTTIADEAFKDCTNLKVVTLPTSVTTIGQAAFSGCTGLQTLTVSSNLRSIQAGAFNGSGLFELEVKCDPTHPDLVTYFAAQIPTINYVIIEEGIQNIGQMAFYNCTGLRYILLNDGVTALGTSAFEGCTQLMAITLPNTVTSLANKVFARCSSLSSIQLSETMTEIGASAFEESGLTRLTIPATVTLIGEKAFASCNRLSEVIVEAETPPTLADVNVFDATTYQTATLTVPLGCIGAYQQATGWREFASIKQQPGELTDSQGVTYRYYPDEGKAEVIAYSGSATLIVIPETVTGQVGGPCTVTSIGGRAFWEATFESITIPSTVTSIGMSAFAGANLKEIDIPSSVTIIQGWAFADCANLTVVKVNWLTGTSSTSTTNIYVNQWAFDNPTNATLCVPNGTKSLYEEVVPWTYFNNIVEGMIVDENGICYALNGDKMQVVGYQGTLTSVAVKTTVTMNSQDYDVTSIAAGAFVDSPLTSITIPASVRNIADGAFVSTLKKVTIIRGLENNYEITDVAEDLFAGGKGTSIEEVTFADGIEHVQMNAFKNCTSLKRVNLTLSTYNFALAFAGCSDLTLTVDASDYTLPNYYNGFSDYSDIFSKVIVNEGVTTIPNRYFNACGMTDVVLPSTLKTIADVAFFSCDNLVTVDFLPEGLEFIGEMAFSQCASLTSVELPSTVKVVSETAFQLCGSLQRVKLNEGLKTVGYAAFSDCNLLESITIPSSVETIEDWAFGSADQTNLSKVCVYWQTPLSLTGKTNVFASRPDNATLYVPVGTKTLYAEADVWKDFTTIIEYTPGNADGNDVIDINDALAIVNYILGKNVPATFNAAAADVNGDGDVTIADAAAVVNIILGTGN